LHNFCKLLVIIKVWCVYPLAYHNCLYTSAYIHLLRKYAVYDTEEAKTRKKLEQKTY